MLVLKSKPIVAVFLFSLILFLAGDSEAAGFPLTGRVFERGTQKPLAEANVFILPAKLKATTDSEGRFRFEEVPEGEFEFLVNLAGYIRLTEPDLLVGVNAGRERRLYVERDSYQVYETTIYGKLDGRDDSARSLKASLASQLPGANNDPIRAVQNLPGVSRTSGFSSQVVIQGSAPDDTRYLIDGHPVPIIFHFGGFSSVVLPEALDRVDYLAAGYGPEYGRAMGGLVGVWTRKPDRERLKGFAYADVISAGGAIETPVGEKGSLTLGFRRSYIGEVLKAVMNGEGKDGEEDDGSFTTAPTFTDFTMVYDQPLSSKDDFRLDLIASRDTLGFVLEDPPENDPLVRGNFETATSFVRFIPQWTRRSSERTTIRSSLGFGRDWLKVVLDDQFFRLYLYTLTQRHEVERKWNDRLTSYFGLDFTSGWAKVALNLPDFRNDGGVVSPVSSGDQRRVSVKATSHNLGAYLNQDWKPSSKWTLKPGVRFDYFSTVNEAHLAPRVSVKRNFDSERSLRWAGGIYYQPPRENETAKDVGNPDLTSPYAYHAALTYEQDFRKGYSKGFIFSGGPFGRVFQNLVIPSSNFVVKNGVSQPEFYNNEGEGYAYGYEMLLRYEGQPWNGWLSYTLSNSRRRQPGQAYFPAEFDQTHNINFILGRDLPRNWRVSTRFRYVTGNPITPVASGTFDTDNDAYIPIRGPFFSQRVGAFYQLDLRVDKKWIYDRIVLTGYLDVQNATNRKNVESVSYAYDFSRRVDATGLPIIPSIGIKGEF